MRILFCGDVVGRSGREAVAKYLPVLQEKHRFDAVVLNGENAAHGFGLTPQICEDFFRLGVNVITSGNHAWDRNEIIPYIARESRLIRPANYPGTAPGRGHTVIQTLKGDLLVINVMGRLFMEALDDPFRAVDAILTRYILGGNVKAILVDIHAEASSEKMAAAFYLDGRVSAVFGTHTHVPTADTQILPKGTAFQSDAGMCGDYCSVVGMNPEAPVKRFLKTIPTPRLEPADGPGTLCAVMVDTDPKTGAAVNVQAVRMGPRLHNTHQ